ncbi:N-acetylmuramoyl-L-alanine amidase [Nonomuraea mesophila]|uniref:N-acetylmuramoyl-L-alanine amidase n=1 Tax=Nonomuraea mesophila TaxID=2530382 RepID=A0A4V2Z8I1_9ACTN|nr:peptidoglycan recognition family protein [Nonomuraea mesophila]TDE40486.1 N-acetylmuramoyl-L-alanine amidase [Nonomuraea mesophila]
MPWRKELADVARKTGHHVIEVPGWRTRGHGGQPAVHGIVMHHTAGRDDMHVVRDGRPGLSGPLSHFWLGRTGAIYVVAAGHCNHNAPSTSPHHTNSASIGIEAENTGYEPWPDVQLDAYLALVVELCREFGLPASRVKGHWEVNRGKIDPRGINMSRFRAAVAARLEGEDVSAHDILHGRHILMNKGTKSEERVSVAYYLQHLESEQDKMIAILGEIRDKLAQL